MSFSFTPFGGVSGFTADEHETTNHAGIPGVGGSPGPVETRTASSAISSADNGKVLYVPSGNPQVDLTFDAGLPEGFEISIFVEPLQDCSVIPQAGQQMGLLGSEPAFLPAGDPAVSANLHGGGASNSSARWKLSGAKWLPLFEDNFAAVPASTIFWFAGGLETYVSGSTWPLGGLETGSLQAGDPAAPPGATIPFDAANFEKDVLLGGVKIVDAGLVAVAIPYVDPVTGLQVLDINPGSGNIEFQPGVGPGGLVSLSVNPEGSGIPDIVIDIDSP